MPAVVILVLGTRFSIEGKLSHISPCEQDIRGERIITVPAPVQQWPLRSNSPALSLPQ